ncbi:hypothetical protein EMIT0111MI5_90107 [Burkholderia sp. IT-111MI5]
MDRMWRARYIFSRLFSSDDSARPRREGADQWSLTPLSRRHAGHRCGAVSPAVRHASQFRSETGITDIVNRTNPIVGLQDSNLSLCSNFRSNFLQIRRPSRPGTPAARAATADEMRKSAQTDIRHFELN